jgi:formate C-acetyltransferase
LAGTTTSKPIGVLLYPDFLALAIWPELETLSRRPKNPFRITQDEIDELNTKIFPFWMGETVQEVTRKENPHSQSLSIMEKLIFFLTSKVYCISHTIPNYGIVVERGLSDLIKEAEAREKDFRWAKKDFYKAVQLFKGIITYAQHLASEAERLASQTNDPKRRQELLEMSGVCKWVPAERPRTFREALNAVWICKVALHQENANAAMSLGRLDQILYPFYRLDRERGMTLEEAIELVGCFWLKMADHVPLMTQAGEEVFGGTGSNQAITLGGIDMEGKDAVNELTHIMLKVTELLKLRDPNVNARYCPGVNAREYLMRLYEVNKKPERLRVSITIQRSLRL